MTNIQLEKILDKKLEDFQIILQDMRDSEEYMEYEERIIGRIETLNFVKQILMSPKEWLEKYDIN